MYLLDIEEQFDRLCRLMGITDYDPYKNDWINQGYQLLCKLYNIPSLKLNQTILSVASQDTYPFPYPYDGMEVSIIYNNRRLDPYCEEMLDLVYEYQGGGTVKLYDWAGIMESPLVDQAASPNGAVITNQSTNVTSAANPFTAAMVGEWIRFGPFDSTGDLSLDSNPGNYGYLIGTFNAVNDIDLTEAYRGPSSVTAYPAPFQVRPFETQMFRVYGMPGTSNLDIEMKIYRNPRRLYNEGDSPEMPTLGLPISYMGVVVGLRHLGRYEEAGVWFQDSVGMMENFKRRREAQGTGTPDLPMSNISRPTGVPVVRGKYRIR